MSQEQQQEAQQQQSSSVPPKFSFLIKEPSLIKIEPFHPKKDEDLNIPSSLHLFKDYLLILLTFSKKLKNLQIIFNKNNMKHQN